MRLVRETATIVKFAFDKRPMAGPETVDIPPRAGAAKGELVWRGPHHGAIFFVQRQDTVRLATVKERPRMEGISPRRDGWPGEPVKWVIDVIVNRFDHEQDENLFTYTPFSVGDRTSIGFAEVVRIRTENG